MGQARLVGVAQGREVAGEGSAGVSGDVRADLLAHRVAHERLIGGVGLGQVALLRLIRAAVGAAEQVRAARRQQDRERRGEDEVQIHRSVVPVVDQPGFPGGKW
jgi:hypothetical protein